jgi:small subunit ribosomal protein S1
VWKNTMSESFAELFEESFHTLDMRPGALVFGTVLDIDGDWVTVNAGLKSEAIIPIEQFCNHAREIEVKIGDTVKVSLESVEDGTGETRLSREKAKRAEVWEELQAAFAAKQTVTGVINNKVKGGFTVMVNGMQGFLPGSLVDVRPVRDDELAGQESAFKIVKMDTERNNMVVSRRAVMQEVNGVQRDELLANLAEGMEVKGYVKNLTSYGAFVDLGGVDGLLHITDMAWKRIAHPGDMLDVGDEITTRVIKFDKESGRLSLGIKQLQEDPWSAIEAHYPKGMRTIAKVTNITDYGCFASLADGIEGLVHISEISWINKSIRPSKVMQVGAEVEVMVLDVDQERRRISLSIKQCQSNPWEQFAERYAAGDQVQGNIKTITDFGIFVNLQGELDGLVHCSDIAWELDHETALQQYQKGQTVNVMILSIDVEKERIALGIKQLADDPFNDYITANDLGCTVTGMIKSVTSKEAVVELAEGIDAILKMDEISMKLNKKSFKTFKAGDNIEARIIGFDRHKRVVNLSVGETMHQESQVIPDACSRQMLPEPPTTIGDLIRAEVNRQ